MKRRLSGIALAVALSGTLLLGDTESYYDKEYDFGGLRAWDFKEQRRIARDPLAADGLWARTVREEIAVQLVTNGFERTAADPDFLVAFYIGLRERYAARDMEYGFPGTRLRRPFWWARGWATPTDIWAVPYTGATLIIDVIDAPSNMLVWRGVDTPTREMSHADRTLDMGVERVLEQLLDDVGRRPRADRN